MIQARARKAERQLAVETAEAVMQNGELIETGPARQVLQKPQDAYTCRLLAAVPRL